MPFIGNAPARVPLTSADITDSVITSAKIVDGTIALADLSATGTKNSTTFLRGDNTFAEAGGGKVLQVITATDSTLRSTTSTSFVTASNTLSVTITPSSTSNKILILSSIPVYAANYLCLTTIYRDSTNLGNGTNGMSKVPYGNQTNYGHVHLSYLDSPSTTSAITYQIYFRTTTNSVSINGDGDGGSTGTITCLEIKG